MKNKVLTKIATFVTMVGAGFGSAEPSVGRTTDLMRTIALFKAGEVCQTMRLLATLAHTEEGSVFLADIQLRVFDDSTRAADLLRPWAEVSGRATARLSALAGDAIDATALDCATCKYSDRSLDAGYFYLARAERGVDLDAKFDLAMTLLGEGPLLLRLDEDRLDQDYGRAFKLFEELAEARHARAMYIYAAALLRPRGVEVDGLETLARDRDRGLALLKGAAALGEDQAAKTLRKHYGHPAETNSQTR